MNEARLTPPSQIKKRKGPEPPPVVAVDGNTNKRTKTSEPGGLVPNWKKNAGIMSSVTHKHPVDSEAVFIQGDNEDDLVEGEFDKDESTDTLNTVRASKPSTVRINTKVVHSLIAFVWWYLCPYMQIVTKFTSRPVSNLNAPTPSTRTKPTKVVVGDLPFPSGIPRMAYSSKWQKEFRPTLLSWASTFQDPYATNTQLNDTVLLDMWDTVYPDIDLDEEERRDTALKLVYLVCVVLSSGEALHVFPGREHSTRLAHCHWHRCLECREKLFPSPGQSIRQRGHRGMCKMGPQPQEI